MLPLKNISRKIFISLCYYAVVFGLLVVVLAVTNHLNLFTDATFLNADAAHYKHISDFGYDEFRTAFFPFLPFVWKLLTLNAAGMALFNGLLFIIAVSVFASFFEMDLKTHLLLLSVPSLLFMFFPYTESLFFVFGLCIILGLYEDSFILIALGLLLSSVVRPTSFVFIPAIIITEYFTRTSVSDFIKRSIYYTAVLIGGLFITFYIQFLSTGKWFVFFEAQKGWNNHLQMPHLPLESWASGNVLRLDGAALLAGLIAAGVLVNYYIMYYKDNMRTAYSKAFMFSLLYLAGTVFVILLFRGGNLYSANRFIFATPYFLLVFYQFIKNVRLTIRQIIIWGVLLLLFWLLFESYGHILTFFYYLLLTLIILILALINQNNKTGKWAYIFSLSVFVSFQLYFYFRLLNNEWVG